MTEGDTLADYTKYHLENFEEKALNSIFGNPISDINAEDFLEKLQAICVVFSLKDSQYCTIIDFCINTDLNPYLIAVYS